MSEQAAPGRDGVRFRERLHPAPWVWLVALLLAGMAGVVPVPYGAVPAVSSGVGVGVVLVALLVAWTPTVEVSGGELRAGRAHVPLAVLGPAVPLDREAMRREQGRDLDARAFLFTRGWVPTGCRVELLDPADPTPYWLLSTRRPAELAAALAVDPRLEGAAGA